jgi:Restriction endonuclease BsobI
VLPPRIKKPADLVTKAALVEEGFLWQARAKYEKAIPYVEGAYELKAAIESINTIDELVNLERMQSHLFTAAALSDKSSKNLKPAARAEILKEMLNVLASKTSNWKEELLYRYLLTKGDSLGGVMRNVVGAEAGKKFTQVIAKALEKLGIESSVKRSKSGKVQEIRWPDRVLLIDKKCPLIKKSVDCQLLRLAPSQTVPEALQDKTAYLACGELKGGIDPAGADEHWKTGDSALGRIRDKLSDSNQTVRLFVIAAAIASSMADEIFGQLRTGELNFAANLTDENQTADLADWLIGLTSVAKRKRTS